MADTTSARIRLFDAIRAAAVGWDGSDPIRRPVAELNKLASYREPRWSHREFVDRNAAGHLGDLQMRRAAGPGRKENDPSAIIFPSRVESFWIRFRQLPDANHTLEDDRMIYGKGATEPGRAAQRDAFATNNG
jgi:hypothetical protein